MKLLPNAILSPIQVVNASGVPLRIPFSSGLTHLQFRRFVGCPICSLHLRGFAKHSEELKKSGIQEVIFFHSNPEELMEYQKSFPFPLIADPGKSYYHAFGVEKSFWASRHPKAVWKGILGAMQGLIATKATGGTDGLPADFLLNPEGKIIALHYGTHADDQWSVKQVLEFAGSAQ